MLKKANVTCSSCHFELIQAAGGGQYEAYIENGELKTAMVLGAGQIKKSTCLTCHDKSKDIKEFNNTKLMHQKHVTIKNARCMECHEPIMHAKAVLTRPMPKSDDKVHMNKMIHDQTVQNGCAACHPEPHRYQQLLAAGPKRKGVIESPDPMHRARTNCLGCHVELGMTDKGEKILSASAKTCVKCHTKDHEKMLEDWKTELSKEIEFVKEVEEEALDALKDAQEKLPELKVAKATMMLQEGRENLHIVQFGNGVHNKKYAMFLIDAAITNFEDLIDYLEEATE
jgi:hypothetical protein